MKKSNIRSNITITLISIIMFLLGLLIFFYPTISNYLANKQYEKAINLYNKEFEQTSEEDLSHELELAEKYNKSLNGVEVRDPFIPGVGYALPDNYQDVLNIFGTGVMGYIEIPKISLKIPIYHGSEEKVLSKGIGHLENSSLPIGGVGNNPILTGHRGLPSAELFTRLDELSNNDVIYIRVLNKDLAYKVEKIFTILPKEINKLKKYPDKDMITLITCTPYGVNTHRLIVQAIRTDYIEEEKEDINPVTIIKLSESLIIRLIGIPLGLILLFIIIIIYRKKKAISKKEKTQIKKKRVNSNKKNINNKRKKEEEKWEGKVS